MQQSSSGKTPMELLEAVLLGLGVVAAVYLLFYFLMWLLYYMSFYVG